MDARGRILVLADDPVASAELEKLCTERGWSFARASDGDGAFDIVLG